MGRARATLSSSSSSSTQSNIHSTLSSSSSSLPPQTDLSTDLRLGLSISSSCQHENCSSRNGSPNWPPIKSLLRNTIHRSRPSFFVKVYMEGIPIGRKIDLYTHCDYDGLIQMLCHMFKTTIHFPDAEHVHNDKSYLLTYEDKEGDWMMVGDVPWDFFLTTVKKLRISRADKC
ncbi:hypothetical protein AQUCO_00300262v1 [Aquilegia coerulea]|uniref:Auxin-responsive protein n=1 Tax=Aquilegia coerulea TaxID=218851 RepID=A0A2G5EY33_AQUCA|nr:hypothetical protein AQUCO_00300262v1 [Aquilegia coerulea]